MNINTNIVNEFQGMHLLVSLNVDIRKVEDISVGFVMLMDT